MTGGAPDAVLAIDVGSSAVRAAVVDLGGHRVAELRIERTEHASGLGFDATILRDQVFAAITGLPLDAKARVGALCIAGHIGTVFLDAGARPVGFSTGWADASGIDELGALVASNQEAVRRVTGRPVPGGGGLAAALGLARRDPEVFGRVRHVVQPKDYLVSALTGIVATDQTSAAYTGAFDVAGRQWAGDLLDRAGIDRDLFPPAVASSAIVGEVLPSIAADLGLPSGLAVVAGGPDGTIGATLVLGSGTDLVADIAGTTDVLVRLTPSPSGPPSAAVNPYTLAGLWSIGGPTGSTGGTVTAWARLLGYAGVAEALAARWPGMVEAGPGSGGLMIHPSLSGSRFPRWAPGERGTVVGQTEEHGHPQFLRAVIEGAAYIVREGVDVLAGDDPVGVVLAGGAARSRELAQLRADVLGRPVVICDEPDVSLLGAATVAAIGIGRADAASGSGWSTGGQVVDPDPALSARYDELFAVWQRATGLPA